MRRENGNSKLTREQVISIRRRLDAGTAARVIQDEFHDFGISLSAEAIRRIGRREVWRWVEEEVAQEQAAAVVSKMDKDISLARLAKYGPDGGALARSLLASGRLTQEQLDTAEPIKEPGLSGVAEMPRDERLEEMARKLLGKR